MDQCLIGTGLASSQYCSVVCVTIGNADQTGVLASLEVIVQPRMLKCSNLPGGVHAVFVTVAIVSLSAKIGDKLICDPIPAI